MCQSAVDKKINLSFLILLLCLCENVFSKNPFKSGEGRVDYPKGCAYLRCKRGDQCVNRKFWCKNPTCPSMLFCSKSSMESLKGPSSCGAVRCSKGYICLVRARHCRWDEGCEQQIARCISERDYYEGPASCVDFQCPSGLQCILRESLCVKPPCKLLKSCATTKDMNIWREECKSLGCLSEHECFLRKPEHDCLNPPCKHSADCSAKSDEELERRELCRGWVCPKEQECSAHTNGPCKLDSCRISRSCHKPVIIPYDTNRLPQHNWRDDIKFSFYSNNEKNIPEREKNDFSSGQEKNQIIIGNSGMGNKKNPTNLADTNFNPNDKVPVDVSLNSRSSFPRSFSTGPDMTSGQVRKPAVTSLTTWLNHLKLMTGLEAIEIWIKRADKQENYDEFVEWLDSVKDMLGSAAYVLWLEEVRAMTMTNKTFQKWLPPSPTNRTMDSRHLVETNGKSSGGSYEGLGISINSQDTSKSPHDTNDFELETIHERAGMRNNSFDQQNHIIWQKNNTRIKYPSIIEENIIFDEPEISPSQPTIEINEWPQFYPPYPTIFSQTYPFQQNYHNILPWENEALPYQGFHNMGLANPAYQQFQSNWSFQQPLDNIPNFLPSQAWQNNQLYSPLYPQWQQARDPRHPISPVRKILNSQEIPPEYSHPLSEEPLKFYTNNYTNLDSSWIDDPYDNTDFQSPENFGSYPIDDRNFGYPNWPSSNYEGLSLINVPHRRSKHSSSSWDPERFRWNDIIDQRSGEKLSDPRKNLNLYNSRFPWNFMDPILHEDSPINIFDYNRKNNFYDKNNRDRSVISSGLSRTHPIDSPPLLSLANRYFLDNEGQIYRPEYHWTNSYPRDSLYKILGGRSPFPSIKMDPLKKLKSLEVNDEGTQKFVFGKRVNDVPGQSMGFPDLWNSRYRNSFSSILRKFANKEENENRHTLTGNRSTYTIKIPSVVPSSRQILVSQVMSVPRKNIHHQNDKYENDEKKFDDYIVEEDDGIYPLLLSLQGYIESPSREIFNNFANPSKNLTILPVYKIESDPSVENYYDDGYETRDENPEIPSPNHQGEEINFFQNKKYGGSLDFSDNLKNLFDDEAALNVQNQTGNSDVAIDDVKWEYENNHDSNIEENPPNFWDQSQSYTPLSDELSKNVRGSFGNVSEMWNGGRAESDYYDERVDYSGEVVPRDRSYSDLEEINEDGSLNHEGVPDDPNDRFYDDSEHKTFKKNRPL